MVFNNSGFCFYFFILLHFCSLVFKLEGEGGAGWKAAGWPVLSSAELDLVLLGGQRPFCQVTHCPPVPGKPGFFSKSESWNKIKCECCLVCGAPGWPG